MYVCIGTCAQGYILCDKEDCFVLLVDRITRQ